MCLRSSASECRESRGEALDIPCSRLWKRDIARLKTRRRTSFALRGGGAVVLPIRLNENRRKSVPLKKAPRSPLFGFPGNLVKVIIISTLSQTTRVSIYEMT